MKQMTLSLRAVLTSLFFSGVLMSCSPEHGIEFSNVTTELEVIVLSNSAIELKFDQVIGVRATATKNDEYKPK